MMRTEKLFDWELFDAQPSPVKMVTWEHNLFPEKLVKPEDLVEVVTLMLEAADAYRRDARVHD